MLLERHRNRVSRVCSVFQVSSETFITFDANGIYVSRLQQRYVALNNKDKNN